MNGTHRFAELVSTIIRVAVSVGVPLVKGASKGSSVKVLKPLQINHYKPKIEDFYQISINCSLDSLIVLALLAKILMLLSLLIIYYVSNKSLQF